MTPQQEQLLRKAIDTLVGAKSEEFNNEDVVKVARRYLDYCFDQIRNDRPIRPPREAGYGWCQAYYR